jgi:predicted Zn-dependent protease
MYRKISLISLILLQITSVVCAQEESRPTIQELKEQADAVLGRSNVSARRDIDVVFELADRLLEIQETDSAEGYLYKGLQHDPWDLEHQIVYANLLEAKGEVGVSVEKARFVLQYAECEAVIDKAKQLLGIPLTSDFQNIQRLPEANYSVVLVPLQNCEKWLISKLKADISHTLGVPVYIQKVTAQYPEPSRDLRGQLLNRIRRQIEKEGLKDPQLASAMKELNLNQADLRNDTNIIRLMERLLAASGGTAIERFQSNLKDAEGKNPQWSAAGLQAVLFKSVAPYRGQKIAYLGITSEDIYEKDYNFLFGWANPRGGVMSYHRFTAVFNDELPNQDRLIKRTKMQALSSIGHIYGIKRCTNPTCARAYPHSLSEHDAKEGTLCAQCEGGFKKLFEVN